MKCPECGGAGVIQGQAPGFVSCCPACDGKGFIELTNEQWLCQLSTEEKAKWLRSVRGYCSYINNCKQCHTKCKNGGWEGWLKAVHK